MNLVIIIGIITLGAGIYGVFRYARSNRPLAIAYSALASYSLGMLLLWASYALRDENRPFSFLPAMPDHTNVQEEYHLVLDLAWLAVVGTGLLLMFAVREYTKQRVRALGEQEPVDRLDLLPPLPKKRRKKRRRRNRQRFENRNAPRGPEE
jgi:hypothetical protein